jgi:hypothetical protein
MTDPTELKKRTFLTQKIFDFALSVKPSLQGGTYAVTLECPLDTQGDSWMMALYAAIMDYP